jgi:hypothetical protein
VNLLAEVDLSILYCVKFANVLREKWRCQRGRPNAAWSQAPVFKAVAVTSGVDAASGYAAVLGSALALSSQ